MTMSADVDKDSSISRRLTRFAETTMLIVSDERTDHMQTEAYDAFVDAHQKLETDVLKVNYWPDLVAIDLLFENKHRLDVTTDV